MCDIQDSDRLGRERFEFLKSRYIDALSGLFFYEKIPANDIVNYFAAILRNSGSEDRGWDPHEESRELLEDLDAVVLGRAGTDCFPEFVKTQWRIALLMYCHIVEMSSIYEVILNLASYKLGEGVRPNPFFKRLSSKEKKSARRYGIPTYKKIEILKTYAEQLNMNFGAAINDFYDSDLRNAVSHSDYTLTDKEFRTRRGMGIFNTKIFRLPEVDEKLSSAKAFLAAFFQLEYDCKRHWGSYKGKAIPYDPAFKGMIEILTDCQQVMVGFRVLWPNGSVSELSRTEVGPSAINCFIRLDPDRVELFVDRYARNPSHFSPLVESGEAPQYAPLVATGLPPKWTETIQ